MQTLTIEVSANATELEHEEHTEICELRELQLALIGGGSADVFCQ